jgi:uncharacterized repeat protein (TIGR03806 family)
MEDRAMVATKREERGGGVESLKGTREAIRHARRWSSRPHGIAALAISITVAVAGAAACSDGTSTRSGDPRIEGNSATGADDAGPGPYGVTPPVRAEFGLDVRAANATCKAPARPTGGAAVKLEPAFPGVTITRPMALAQIPGDPSRWFLASRDGTIRSWAAASPPQTPPVIASVSALSGKVIREEFEGGFLNFVIHPKFAENGRAYVYFTTNGNPYASEVGYLTSTDRGASFTSYTHVLGFDRPRLEHNGGGMAFGRDGYLYIGFGDGANDKNAQNKDILFGKIIRIDVDHVPGGATYGIPADNPFAAGGGRPEIFAWGFRNPFRISIDRSTGELWEGDVGHASYEEVNRVERGGNYGWPCREGMHDHLINDASVCPSKVGLIDPIVEHAHDPTPNSRCVTGGIVYRGSKIPGFQGSYVYADFIRLEAWTLSFDPATGEAKDVRINENGPVAGFSTFTEDLDGEIYVLALFQDSVFKLVAADTGAPAAPAFPDLLSKTGCVDPNDPKKPAPGVIPYGVNAALYSDGAEKERFVALPDGTSITTKDDGDFDLPVGTVLMKNFAFADRRIETRLFVRHDDGDWGGYSYEWTDDQKDAFLLPSGKTKALASVANGPPTWSFPSRSDCMRCHTTAAGRSLGLELGQLDGDFVYPSTNQIANQIKTLAHIGVLSTSATPETIQEIPSPFGEGPVEARARAYLHANCGGCHRPAGGAPRAEIDLRFATPFAATKTCNGTPLLDDLGLGADAKLLAPGVPERSVLSLRLRATDGKRMPPLGRQLVDEKGAGLIDEWIRSLGGCP